MQAILGLCGAYVHRLCGKVLSPCGEIAYLLNTQNTQVAQPSVIKASDACSGEIGLREALKSFRGDSFGRAIRSRSLHTCAQTERFWEKSAGPPIPANLAPSPPPQTPPPLYLNITYTFSTRRPSLWVERFPSSADPSPGVWYHLYEY